jgi:hypothetical protein
MSMAGGPALPALPVYPYLGLRPFDAGESGMYHGRDRSLLLCHGQLRNPAVRVLVLQGLSGSGKSSFLRAGLMPRLSAEAAEQGTDGGVVPISGVVNAGAGMLQTLANQMYTFVMEGPGHTLWRRQVPLLTKRFGTRADFVQSATDGPRQLIAFIEELNENPHHAALIAIDQVEEYFTGPGAADAAARKNFLRIVEEFVRGRLNGKLVLALRTEQYGMFVSRLPESAQPAFAGLRGANKLFQHYLLDPSPEQLVDLVESPAAAFKFAFEPGAAAYIVNQVCQAATSPEMCVLPLLQTVLLRLYLGAREHALREGGPVVILKSAFDALSYRADRESTGFLSDFVEWGLGEAVHAVLQLEPGSRALRSEVSAWHEVLRAMSGRSEIGVRIRQRTSLADIERLALAEKCLAGPTEMARVLCGPGIGLLSPPDADGRFALQHDLICLSFDLEPAIGSRSFWVQGARNRRQRTRLAADYGIDDLFDAYDKPAPQTLRVSELRFWDHKSLAYAEHQGFFARLGLQVELVDVDVDISAADLRRKLHEAPGAHAVFSYPRVLMNAAELEESRDIVVLNSFAGYAVVCNARAARTLSAYDEKENWEGFDRVCTALMQLHVDGCRFEPEDDGARDFLRHMLDIHSHRTGDDDVRAAVDRVRAMTHSSELAGLEFVNALRRSESEPWVAIVTTPTWALAMVDKRSILPVIDQRTLLGLLDSYPADLGPDLAALRRKLEVRNVMNLSLGVSLPGQDAETLMMRLVAVGMFVADYIWAQDREASNWIRKRWIDAATQPNSQPVSLQRVSLPVFMGTFRRSCGYVTAHEHGRRYFGTTWDDDCPMALSLNHRWRQAEMDYERQLAALTALQRQDRAEPDALVRRLVERASKHAEIDNYFDAQRLIADALQRLGRTGGEIQPPRASEAP